MNYAKEAYKVSLCTSVVNAVLAAFKMAAGILGGSSALISDVVDSACDVFSSLIVMIGVKFASKSPDEDHPYGHERFECISSIVLALIIGATGLGVGWSAVGKIFPAATCRPRPPSPWWLPLSPFWQKNGCSASPAGPPNASSPTP